MVPAAVISMGKNLGSAAAASKHGVVAGGVACELSTSIICASVVRGIMSAAIAGDLALGEGLHQLDVGQRIEQTDERRARAQFADLRRA